MALTITPAEAQGIHDAATASGDWMIRFVSLADPSCPGKAVAWAMTTDLRDGAKSPGLLVADTLEEVRAMLPAGLTRQDRTALMARNVLET